ncbi:hypothetical protein ACE6H2_018709 [Prunus campanulata]
MPITFNESGRYKQIVRLLIENETPHGKGRLLLYRLDKEKYVASFTIIVWDRRTGPSVG